MAVSTSSSRPDPVFSFAEAEAAARSVAVNRLALVGEREDDDPGSLAEIDADALEQLHSLRSRVRAAVRQAQASVRRDRRRDEWDIATELRISGAAERVRPLLNVPVDSLEAVAMAMIDEAIADSDIASLLALRREVPAAARRVGLDTSASERLLVRLDMLAPDPSIGRAIARGRALTHELATFDALLSSIEQEITGAS